MSNVINRNGMHTVVIPVTVKDGKIDIPNPNIDIKEENPTNSNLEKMIPAITFEDPVIYTTQGIITCPPSSAENMRTIADINNEIVIESSKDLSRQVARENGYRAIADTCYMICDRFNSALINIRKVFETNVSNLFGFDFNLDDNFKINASYIIGPHDFNYDNVTKSDIISKAISIVNSIGSNIYNNTNTKVFSFLSSTVTSMDQADSIVRKNDTMNKLFRLMMADMTYEASVFAETIYSYKEYSVEYDKMCKPFTTNRKNNYCDEEEF